MRDKSPKRSTPIVAPRDSNLFRDGYLVIPTDIDVAYYRDRIDKELETAPEFLPTAYPSVGYVGGGFSALSTASSFHNLTVRRLRTIAARHVTKYFQQHECPYPKIEVIIDRLMWRPIGAKPSPEAWHRDESPPCEGLVLGGWLNLDAEPQYLSCVPRTQADSEGRGFAKIPKSQHKELRARRQLVEVPPGHILLFNETLIHEVLAIAKDFVSRRLFLAWRLCNDDKPFFPNIDPLLTEQAVMPLKSGQTPPTYPKLWLINHRQKLGPLANQFVPKLTERLVIAGDNVLAPKRFLPSLDELGALYPDYTDVERQLYRPHNIKP